MELSEKQLLLLSEFMYLPQSVKKDTISSIIKSLKDESGNYNPELLKDVSGGISVEEAEAFLKEIEKDETLMNLQVEKSINTGVRASCFVDSRKLGATEAALVFRGTGGIHEAWADNVRGFYQTETMMQQEAVKFVAEDCKNYDIK